MEENKNLLLKGAMTYGLAMGIYWVVKYIFFHLQRFRPLLKSCLLAIDARRPFHRLLHDEKISARHRWKDQFLSCMEIRHDVVFFRRIDRLA